MGLERDAAKAAFDEFTKGKVLSGNQLEFLDLIVDHLTEQGALDAQRLYESPFVDLHPYGVGGLFKPDQVKAIVSILAGVRERAAA